MERVIYELRPYLFLILGGWAVSSSTSGLMTTSGTMLVLSAIYVIYSRLENRGLFAQR